MLTTSNKALIKHLLIVIKLKLELLLRVTLIRLMKLLSKIKPSDFLPLNLTSYWLTFRSFTFHHLQLAIPLLKAVILILDLH